MLRRILPARIPGLAVVLFLCGVVVAVTSSVDVVASLFPDPPKPFKATLEHDGMTLTVAGRIHADGRFDGAYAIDAAEPSPAPQPDPPAPPPPSSQRVLVPGSGWTGPTSASGSGARPPARWNVVPYDVASLPYAVGLRAFHATGIDRVEFAVDGGAWVAVRDWAVNPRTGMWEYFAVLDPGRWSTPRIVEVRAVAFPKSGAPRILDPMRLWVDPARTVLPTARVSVTGDDASAAGPFRTIKKAASYVVSKLTPATPGAVVELEAGVHWYASPANQQGVLRVGDRWLTVRPAPGLARDAASITSVPPASQNQGTWPAWSRASLYLDRVRLADGLLVDRIQIYENPADKAAVWFDHARWTWRDWAVQDAPNVLQGYVESYDTGTEWFDVPCALRGARLVSGSTIDRLQDQAFFHCLAVYDVRVRAHDTIPGTHSDTIHLEFGSVENAVYCGIVAEDIRAQGVYFDKGNLALARDVAIVNCLFDQTTRPSTFTGQGAGFFQSSISSPTENLLILHSTWRNQRLNVDTDRPHPGLTVRGCRIDPGTLTTPNGSPMVGDWRDNRIGTTGPETCAPLVPFDAYGRARGAVTSVGAVEVQ